MIVPIDGVVIRDRIRRDLGDLEPLILSIKEVGLLHPPAVRRDGRELVLVAGRRRLEALRRLGRERVAVTVCESVTDELLALKAELEENTARLPLTPAELHAAAETLLPGPGRPPRSGKGRPFESGTSGAGLPLPISDRKWYGRPGRRWPPPSARARPRSTG